MTKLLRDERTTERTTELEGCLAHHLGLVEGGVRGDVQSTSRMTLGPVPR
jgi:hypothetical protein